MFGWLKKVFNKSDDMESSTEHIKDWRTPKERAAFEKRCEEELRKRFPALYGESDPVWKQSDKTVEEQIENIRNAIQKRNLPCDDNSDESIQREEEELLNYLIEIIEVSLADEDISGSDRN